MESFAPPDLDRQAAYRRVFSKNHLIVSSLLSLVLALFAFWWTCYPSITWWDTAEYATAAICLGNPHPPGSLLLTLVGWMATRLPLGLSDIFSLNLLASLMAAATGGMVAMIAARLLETTELAGKTTGKSSATRAALIGVSLGSLVFALGETLWLYAVKFTPYVLTVLFTSLILWTALGWWRNADRADACRWLLILGLLIGLDFSVHRTNAVLLPGLFLWILIRRPQTIASIRSWLTGIAGLLLGLSVHLLIMPIAARNPFLNGGHPHTWSGFWNYVSLRQLGGGFLVNFLPRKGDFFGDQVMDFIEAFATNFFSGDGLWFFGWLPLLLGAVGLFFMCWRNRRLAVAYSTLFLVTIAITILYFNIPADFFRSLHRHYLPCLLIFGVLIAYGGGSLALKAWNLAGKSRSVAVPLVGLLMLTFPASQIARNYSAIDGSRSFFAEDFARNMFAGLEPNAIVLVSGDNDTFPMWTLQVAEHFRPDVTVLNINLLNTTWYVRDQLGRDSLLPLSLTAEETDQLAPQRWTDTVITLATPEHVARFALPPDATVPDSLHLRVGPSFENFLLVADQLILQIFRENRWQRPFYLAGTAGPSRLPWLQPYLRFEGLVAQAVPLPDPPINADILRRNILERFSYRGWDDPSVSIEDVSRQMAINAAAGFLQLAQAQLAAGDAASAAVTLAAFDQRLPMDRLQPPEQIRRAVEQLNAAAGN